MSAKLFNWFCNICTKKWKLICLFPLWISIRTFDFMWISSICKVFVCLRKLYSTVMCPMYGTFPMQTKHSCPFCTPVLGACAVSCTLLTRPHSRLCMHGIKFICNDAWGAGTPFGDLNKRPVEAIFPSWQMMQKRLDHGGN